MKKRFALVTAVAALMLCSGIPYTTAYSSSVTDVFEIGVQINELFSIRDSGDVKNILEKPNAIVAVNGDTHKYSTVPLPAGDSGHPATVISAQCNPNANSDIVGKGESFNIDITVPKGVYFKLKVEMVFPTGSGVLKVTSDCLSGSLHYSKAADGFKTQVLWYVGSDGSVIAKSGDFGKVGWVCNETDSTIFHVEGTRENAQGQPGQLRVTMIMKETVTDL